MNYWIICGAVVTFIGGALSTYGLFIQQRSDLMKDQQIEKFQNEAKRSLLGLSETSTSTLETTKAISDKISKSSNPEVLLTGIGIDKENSQYVFHIENVGGSTAETVELHLDYSVPGGKGRTISKNQVISGRETIIKSEVLPHYSMLINAAEGRYVQWKKEYDDHINQFKAGEKAFVTHIELVYFWGEKNTKSEKYGLVHTRDGIEWYNDCCGDTLKKYQH
ncbi:hypothetical protein [Moritella sp. Urea-trap-13]|uniref:hypothetical protein n=1 Tax=Moritella sp. Urea-trap-13 TaxID=2058327 RepID=UPI000C33D38F|nr:hypothetical protein [Moritella sp. Urea-trap-13]PKH06501.1 hypothetical protein CXF93_11375 [Moritella sp. Urea-trap-13]